LEATIQLDKGNEELPLKEDRGQVHLREAQAMESTILTSILVQTTMKDLQTTKEML
jgi:hypothetical protein